MGKALLPPGFRFHPTDVELIMYYLKRKITGRKLHFEAIAEVDIYKFSPWDLPDMSCLKSKDLEWFFFSPRENKYASGVRVKRATENGYWKTTGRGRPIRYDDQVVGIVKTLVFHLGNSPRGTRTDWIIHEYRISDEQLGNAGHRETYTLCKVFKKSGMGPKNGEQHGALYNKADWSDNDIETVKENASTSETKVPYSQGTPSVGQFSTDVHVENEIENDILRMLSHFTDDDDTCFFDIAINQDLQVNDEKEQFSDGLDMFEGLGDLEYLSNHYTTNTSIPENLGYIELDDLMWPLSSSTEDPFGCYGINDNGFHPHLNTSMVSNDPGQPSKNENDKLQLDN